MPGGHRYSELDLELLAGLQIADERDAGGGHALPLERFEEPAKGAVDDRSDSCWVGYRVLDRGVLGGELTDLGLLGHRSPVLLAAFSVSHAETGPAPETHRRA